KSARQLAVALGVDHKTVLSVRSEMEGIGEIPQCPQVATSDGRKYPSRRPAIIAKNAQEARRAVDLLKETPVESLPNKFLDVRRAERLAREGRRRQAPPTSHEPMPAGIDIRCGDLAAVLTDIPSGSVDLILTDPPYGQAHSAVWGRLGDVAARLLRPGG